MSEHTILVAFTLEADNRLRAHTEIMDALSQNCLVSDSETRITSWWVAEDDREDRSDNDSAVFVKPGAQATAVGHLYGLGLTDYCNLNQGAESHFPEVLASTVVLHPDESDGMGS